MSIPACPFPGLLPFQEKDAPFFFGRDRETAELLLRLERSRFVAVIGVSGSGKSSLVHAGLKPELRFTQPPWRIVEMKPGSGPRRRLQSILEPVAAGVNWSDLLGRSSYGLVDGALQAGLQPAEKLLVIVDQFEEIFSYRKLGRVEAEEADLFVQQLLRACAEPEAPVYVMLTMRTDYLGHCALFRNLPEALNEGTYLVPRLTRDEQEEAIRSPLAVSGVEIEPAVVDQLLNAAEANRDELPVLQHLLKRLWEEWAAQGATGTIDGAGSEKTGSWNNAIDLDAKSVFEPLGVPEQNAVKLVFQRITERGTGERPIRTPCPFADLSQLTSHLLSAERLRQVLEAFRSRDLLVWGDEEQGGSQRIDIPHECVTWRWSRLATWIDEEDRDARRLAFIAESARAGTPLAGSALEEARGLRPRIDGAWVARYKLDAPELRRWIDYSEREAERARQRTRNLVIGLGLAMLLFAALGLWAWQQKSQAVSQQKRAEGAESDAKEKTKLAQNAEADAKDKATLADVERGRAVEAQRRAVSLAGEALARAREGRARLGALLGESSRISLAPDPQLALLLALEAGYATTREGEPQVSAADRALRRALAESGGLLLKVPDGYIGTLNFDAESGMTFSPDQLSIVVVSRFTEGNFWKANLRLFRLKARGLESEVLKGAQEPVVFAPDGRWLATGAVGGGILLWNLRSGQPGAGPRTLGTRDRVDALAASPNGEWLVSAPPALLWNVSGAEPTAEPIPIAAGECLPKREGVSSERHYLQVSPNGRWLISGGWYSGVHRGAPPPPWHPCLTDLQAKNPASSSRVLVGHTRSVTEVIFSETGRWMGTYSREGGSRGVDNSLRIWDLEATGPSRQPAAVLPRPGLNTKGSALLSPDGRWLITGSDPESQLWDLSLRPKPVQVAVREFAGEPLAFGPADRDGSRWLVTVLREREDSTLLWRLKPDKSNTWTLDREDELLARASRLAVSRDQRWLAIGRQDGTVLVSDLAANKPWEKPRRFRGSGSRIDGIELDMDSQHLGIVQGNSARLWSLAQQHGPADPIALRTDSALTAEGRWLIARDYGRQQVDVWDLEEPAPAVPSVAASGPGVEPLALSRDGRRLVSWDHDSRLRLWRLESRDQTSTLLWSPAGGKDSPEQPWYSSPKAAFSPNGRWLAAGFVDGSLRLWDMASSRMVTAKVHDSTVQQVSFDENSGWLLTEDSKGRGCLWKALNEIEGFAPRCQDGVPGVQISGKAPWAIAIAGAKVRLWTVKAGDPWTEPLVIDTGLKSVNGVLMDREGRWLVAHNLDSLMLWRRRPPPPTIAATRLDPPGHVQSIKLSPDGRWLVAGGGWGDVAVWDLLPPVARRMSFSLPKVDLEQWGNLLSLYDLGAGSALAAVWWRADGWKEIVGFANPASLMADRTRVWVDLQEGAHVSYSALSPGSDISAGKQKMISANGRWLVSLEGQTTTLWRLRRQELERLACDTAGRNLTNEEWQKYFPGQAYRKTCEDR